MSHTTPRGALLRARLDERPSLVEALHGWGWQAIHYWLSVLCGGESEEGVSVRMMDVVEGARDVLLF